MNVRNLWALCSSTMIASSAMAFPPGADAGGSTSAGQTSTSALPANQPALPAGHPPLSHATTTTTQPIAAAGSIAVRARQGTQGAAAIIASGSAVSLELYHQGHVIHKASATLDNTGIVIFENVPLAVECQPMIKVIYNGVEYSQLGQVMDSHRPSQRIDVNVFETTEVEPPWHVHMRHILIDPSPEGLQITEMIAIQNPTDRAWIGKPRPDGKRGTVAIPVIDGATNFEFGDGLHGCCVKTENGNLVNTMALVPGATQLSFSYVIPAASVKATLVVGAPVNVKNMMLFIPDNGTTVTVAGLDDVGLREMGNGKTRIFKGTDLVAGHQALLSIAVPKISGASAIATAGTTAPKVIAGVGVSAIVLIGAGLVLFKTPRKAK